MASITKKRNEMGRFPEMSSSACQIYTHILPKIVFPLFSKHYNVRPVRNSPLEIMVQVNTHIMFTLKFERTLFLSIYFTWRRYKIFVRKYNWSIKPIYRIPSL